MNLTQKFKKKSRAVNKQLWRVFWSINRPSAKKSLLVFGVQRSGTNMIMQVFDRSRYFDVYHDSDSRVFKDYQMMESEQVLPVLNKSPFPIQVIKPMTDSYRVRQLLSSFNSHGLWIYRPMAPVVASHLRKWQSMPQYLNKFVNGAGEKDWRTAGLPPSLAEEVKQLWQPGMNNDSACALFWYFRNRLYFDHELHQDERVRLVDYDQCLNFPKAVVKSIFDWLDIPFRDQVIEHIHEIPRPAPQLNIDPAILSCCRQLESEYSQFSTQQPSNQN